MTGGSPACMGVEGARYVGGRSHAARFCAPGCQRTAWRRKDRGKGRPARPQQTEAPAPGKHRPQCAKAEPPTPVSNETRSIEVDGEWIGIINTDAFPGKDVGKVRDAAEAQSVCRRLGLGGYVMWRDVAYLRSQSAEELLSAACPGAGSTLWLPAATLVKAGASLAPLPESLPEVQVAGARPVEKLAGLSVEEMDERFESSRPVVLTDAQEGWPACEKWSFEWMAERFGGERLQCSDLAPFFRHADKGCIQTLNVSMREFMRYCRGEPNAVRAMQKFDSQVFYGNAWNPFTTHESLLNDVSDRLYCVSDPIPREGLGAKDFNLSLTKVFMGPAGTISRLHHDTYATHVWLSQIRGRKQFVVYPPDDAECLHCFNEDETEGRTSLFDPSAPDYDAFPRARRARPYSVVVEEGETVVLPSRWWHWAKSLTPSVTLMRNFVNDTNKSEYVRVLHQVQEARELKKREAAGHDPNGVRLEVLRPGDGHTFPQKGQTVTVHYTGTLAANGAKFDSSHDRGEPFKFKIGLARVIRGWDEGVMKMSLGERSRLRVASDYGYGTKGMDGFIPPDADLVFEVELLAIE